MMRLLAILAAVLVLATPAMAAETITSFRSDVTINLDSSIDVTETITVTVEGDQIKRGILRDFPTRYKDRSGGDVEIGFDVRSVKRDGRDENYGLENISNGVRIRIGNRDVLLSMGPHTYEIAYHANKELGFFDGYDELYWNVTGNGWTFAIDGAEAMVHLPPGANIIQSAAYTGAQGEKGTDFRVMAGEGASYRAVTTRRLQPNEGFTIAVGFTKGIVTPPPPPPPEIDTSRQSIVAFAGGLAVLFFYYLLAWLWVGRDPKGGPIIPLFAAPVELGPAGARYVWKRVFDQKSFASAVIGLAAKGRLKIKGNGSYTLERLAGAGPPLATSESMLYAALPAGALEVKDKNHAKIYALRNALEGSLTKDYGRQTYRANRGWFWSGIVLSIIALVPMIAYVRAEDFALALLITVFGGGLWALFVWLLFLDVRAFFKPGVVRKIFAFVGFVILLPLVIALSIWPAATLSLAKDWTMAIYAAGLAALIVMHVLFGRWLTAPTVLGRKLLDQIEGLRLYMTTAEEKRLDMLNPPEKTPELFEKLLPYALALDCENAWSEKFATVLAAAAYVAPAWYVGGNFNSGFGDFTSELHTSQYDHTASSSHSPGSFSGSLGGGFSGGGGGGGGGSGW